MFRWSATMVLLVVNVACFALQEINNAYWGFPVQKYFALSHLGLADGFVWQVFTFQFLHGDPLHLLLNALCLYMFGRSVEDAVGRTQYLRLYFLSGVAGGLFQAFLGWLWPMYFGASVVGASAGLYGLIAAFTLLNPDGIILAWFFLPIRAKWALIASAAVAVFYILVPAQSRVAHAAHLGGILGGLAYTYLVIQGRSRAFLWRPLMRPMARHQELVRVRSAKHMFWQTHQEPAGEDLPAADFISKEVDPILDKISAHGIHSLTPRERQILEKARARMAKR